MKYRGLDAQRQRENSVFLVLFYLDPRQSVRADLQESTDPSELSQHSHTDTQKQCIVSHVGPLNPVKWMLKSNHHNDATTLSQTKGSHCGLTKRKKPELLANKLSAHPWAYWPLHFMC